MQVTYYEFRKEEVEAAMEGSQQGPGGPQHMPSQIQNKEAFNMLMVRLLHLTPHPAETVSDQTKHTPSLPATQHGSWCVMQHRRISPRSSC